MLFLVGENLASRWIACNNTMNPKKFLLIAVGGLFLLGLAMFAILFFAGDPLNFRAP